MATLYVAEDREPCAGCPKPIKRGTQMVWSSRTGQYYHPDCCPEKQENPKLTICPAGAAVGSNNHTQHLAGNRPLAVEPSWIKEHRMAWTP